MLHKLLKNKKVVLASASPRRIDILKQVGLVFLHEPATIDEDVIESDHLNPRRYVQKLAIAKCNAIKNKMTDDTVVIAADTTVYINKKIFGKPQNMEEAFDFLKILSGQTHVVYTGLAVSYKNALLSGVEKTFVKFKKLCDKEISDYIETQEPMDKAGAYGIQGYGSQFIEKINGCYFNVMGFPVNLFYNLLIDTLSESQIQKY